ncbi:hypothetical protein [Ferrovum sp.]|uniref:hypothetical protein n=1 Tax=Ferrovum sp. TaxID=2609467 RepID=UPI002615D4E1|nr:hypothetical protein [Ferrovum sp.]
MTRLDANLTSDLAMVELIANGKRFAWRVFDILPGMNAGEDVNARMRERKPGKKRSPR